jgi:hypothetical protein
MASVRCRNGSGTSVTKIFEVRSKLYKQGETIDEVVIPGFLARISFRNHGHNILEETFYFNIDTSQMVVVKLTFLRQFNINIEVKPLE